MEALTATVSLFEPELTASTLISSVLFLKRSIQTLSSVFCRGQTLCCWCFPTCLSAAGRWKWFVCEHTPIRMEEFDLFICTTAFISGDNDFHFSSETRSRVVSQSLVLVCLLVCSCKRDLVTYLTFVQTKTPGFRPVFFLRFPLIPVERCSQTDLLEVNLYKSSVWSSDSVNFPPENSKCNLPFPHE